MPSFLRTTLSPARDLHTHEIKESIWHPNNETQTEIKLLKLEENEKEHDILPS